MNTTFGKCWRTPALILCAAALAACGNSQPPGELRSAQAGTRATGDAVEIRILSNRADLVSGGDVYAEVMVPAGAKAEGLKVALGDLDISSAFAVRGNGRILGVATGLPLGDSVLTATLADGRGASITLTNHPVGGPVFAGPQIQPWTCFEGATDAQCNRPASITYVYMPTDGSGFADYDPDSPPSDVGTTTTDQGNTVPYIVRVETGSLDRDEYRMAVLWDPSKPWAPWAPQPGYNGKLVVFHGASCDTSYAQASAPEIMNDVALGRGFATMSHAMNNAGHNCNMMVEIEAMLMTKEHLIETFGEVRYTIGSGCSGGALVQQQVANAFPGFYQGITPACSFFDSWSAGIQREDYSLWRSYSENPAGWAPGLAWDPVSIEAVIGHPNPANPVSFTSVIAPTRDPSRSCPGLDATLVYDAQTNPTGVRCSIQDYTVNLFGPRVPETWTAVEKQLGHGFAGNPSDNVGVQYGLKSLMAGTLSTAHFVDYNSKVGSHDIDYNFQTVRKEADRPALERVYRSAAVNSTNNMDKVAIIDLRGPDPGAFHDVYRTYVIRARLEREHGHADNQVLWRGQVALFGDATFENDSIIAIDSWLAAVEADKRDVPLAQKLREDRPASVTHRCTNGAGVDIPKEECDAVVTSYTAPRIEAGGPFTDDVHKCQLKPLQQSDYFPIFFTAEQWATLEATFPTGVCDYSLPGVDQVEALPWLTYKNVIGGEPMGNPPQSKAH